jgi:hypothetical protein
MSIRHRLHDRRAADRPSSGDTALCPKCGVGTVEFNERYRMALATGETAAIPAWICDRPDCRYEQPARRENQAVPPSGSPADLRARSRAKLLKARAVLQRAKRTVSKSLARKKIH